jgi:glutamine amidotransferase
MKTTVIIDIGICNIFNVKRAVEAQGVTATITRLPQDVRGASSLILPGVGAFGAAMQSLEAGDLIQPIQDFARSGKPVLGICLGMQLLMDHSEERGSWEGLHLIPGDVRALTPPEADGRKFKIPQIGWNTIEGKAPADPDEWQGTILAGLGRPSPSFYFVHSFVVKPARSEHVLARTPYGLDLFCSVIQRDNLAACQFHPERSAHTGQIILANFFK